MTKTQVEAIEMINKKFDFAKVEISDFEGGKVQITISFKDEYDDRIHAFMVIGKRGKVQGFVESPYNEYDFKKLAVNSVLNAIHKIKSM